MFLETLKDFQKQLHYTPTIENVGTWAKQKRFVVVGMGGSGLAARLIRTAYPEIPIAIHQDYGLPQFPDEDIAENLMICNSYSGNTEEVLDAYNKAKKLNIKVAVISTGGTLLKLAQDDGIPYIQMPDWNLKPRVALGLNFIALLKIIGRDDALREISELATTFRTTSQEKDGKALAEKLRGYIPLVYSSQKNRAIAQTWKAILNEDGKSPSFFNVFPELNHNEIAGFEIENLRKYFCFVLLKDNADDERIIKRMDIWEMMVKEKDMRLESVEMREASSLAKIFSALTLAHWTAFYLAKNYHVDPEEIAIIEKFKEAMAASSSVPK